MTGEKKLVLLVDDDSNFAKMLKIYFDRSGLEFVHASSGKKALKCIEGQRPDVMILDIMMPKMNGIEVCTQVRARMGAHYLPIIALTAYHDEEIKKKILACGADLYLTKPIDLRQLVDHVLHLTASAPPPE